MLQLALFTTKREMLCINSVLYWKELWILFDGTVIDVFYYPF